MDDSGQFNPGFYFGLQRARPGAAPARKLAAIADGILRSHGIKRSLFNAAECRVTLGKLLARDNEIVATCETDPTLRVRIPEGPM